MKTLGLLAIFALAGVLLLKCGQCEVYRLPANIRPLRYFLTIEPFFYNPNTWKLATYNGSVTIELEVIEKTASVVLNQRSLNIFKDSIAITSYGEDVITINSTSKNERAETYTIYLVNELLANAMYNLTVKFSGHFGSSKGFFKTTYFDKNHKTKNLAATNFKPYGARYALPCFDEPSLKATFTVNLIRGASYTSISTEELDSTEDLGDGRVKDTFKETPLMSTCSLAFGVTDYKASKKSDRIQIYARPELIDESDYALETSAKILKLLEEYTETEVISKLDEIAIHGTFFRETEMESWGIVVYRETHLLLNDTSPAGYFKRTTLDIAHGLAHQWFGNLVTAAWWDYTWITESFATYFQYHISDIVQPSWRLADQFVIDIVAESFTKEEHIGAHPLNYPLENPGQYPPFHIIHDKGASIVRMMEHFLTRDVFRKGIQTYLNNRKFKSAVPSDLYTAFQKAVDEADRRHLLSDMPLEKIMKTWDSTGGYPHITVTRNYENGEVTIKQIYKFDKGDKIWLWIVPINYVWSSGNNLDFSNTTAEFWLTEESVTKSFNKTDGWILLNKQFSGYYRVNYDLENWNRIIDFLKSDNYSSIHVLNRAQLISDAFKFAEHGFIPWDVPLRLGEYLTRETDYIPLASFCNSILNSVRLYDRSKTFGIPKTEPEQFKYFKNYTLNNDVSTENRTEYEVYKEYVKNVLGRVYDSLGTEPKSTDSHLDQIHRDNLKRFYSFFQ